MTGSDVLKEHDVKNHVLSEKKNCRIWKGWRTIDDSPMAMNYSKVHRFTLWIQSVLAKIETYITKKATFYVIFIELVTLLHSAEASILPDSPRSVGVHGGIGPSSVGKHSWQFICPAGWVCFGVHRLHVDSLRRAPDQILWVLPLQLFLSQTDPFRKQLSLVLACCGGVDQRAACVCRGDRSSNQVPDGHRCTWPLCGQHAYCWLSQTHMDHLRKANVNVDFKVKDLWVSVASTHGLNTNASQFIHQAEHLPVKHFCVGFLLDHTLYGLLWLHGWLTWGQAATLHTLCALTH